MKVYMFHFLISQAGYNKDKQEATFYKAVPSSGAGIVPVEYLAKLL